jgi:hypothetical protein
MSQKFSWLCLAGTDAMKRPLKLMRMPALQTRKLRRPPHNFQATAPINEAYPHSKPPLPSNLKVVSFPVLAELGHELSLNGSTGTYGALTSDDAAVSRQPFPLAQLLHQFVVEQVQLLWWRSKDKSYDLLISQLALSSHPVKAW